MNRRQYYVLYNMATMASADINSVVNERVQGRVRSRLLGTTIVSWRWMQANLYDDLPQARLEP